MKWKQPPPLLEYSHGMPAPWDPLTRRLVAGTLSLILSLAALALVILGGMLRHSGGQSDRVIGNLSMGASLVPGFLAFATAVFARRRGDEIRALAIFATLLNIAYWSAGVYFLLL